MKAHMLPQSDRQTNERPTSAAATGKARPRRGVAVLLVLLMLSMVLGLSYAVVQSQFTAVRIQRNADRHELARRAAVTGLTLALKKMHTNQWAGVDTTLSGSLGDYQGFSVRFTTGDPELVSTDPDYQEWPFRVTLSATGYAADPDNPQAVSTHRIEAVVRLVPRALGTEPDYWQMAVDHTVYQWNYGRFEVHVPCRIEGPVRAQTTVNLSRNYAWPDNVRWTYLQDLNRMRSAGYPDWRPLNGPLRLSYIDQNSYEPLSISWLNQLLGVTTKDVAPRPLNWLFPGTISGYRLYPGGKQYFATILPGTLENVTLEPDPQTNPLGICYHKGETYLKSNVTIRGTVLVRGASGGNIHITGRNVRFESVDLPPLLGEERPVRLPVAVVEDDLRLERGAQAEIRGMLVVWDDFDVKSDEQDDMELTLVGHLAAKEIRLRNRDSWGGDSRWWENRYAHFTAQKDLPDGIPYFPHYLYQRDNLNPASRLQIKPDTSGARYHWQNPNHPFYVPHPNDEGLRWELVRWTDSP